jgi:hypothetical protein
VYILRTSFSFLLFFLFSFTGFAQIPVQKPILNQADTLQSSLNAPNDSISADSVVRKGDIETTVKYFAVDSIRFSVDAKHVYLYGNARIEYGEIVLTGERIEVDYNDNLLIANPVIDSTGKMIGKPVFQEGESRYETTGIKYNFKSKRAYISGVVTEESEGFMHGDEVKKDELDHLYIRNAKYTTCNLEHPHYYIQARRLIVVPSEKVVAGPFNLNINDVPTPIGFPFGMFPAPDQRASGVIFPTYGEEVRRGFFVRNGGFFWAINDYVNFAVTGDAYTTGSYGINGSSTYKKRYKYTGSLRWNYTSTKLGEEGREAVSKDFRINWSHTPQNYGSSRFSININAATNTFNQNNALQIEDNINRTLNSSISYTKSFTGTPFSMGLNSRFTQNLTTKEVTFLLPDLSVNMQDQFPFRKRNQSPRNVIERIKFRYTLSGRNQLNNRISRDSVSAFNFENMGDLFGAAKRGLSHSIPISTSMSLFKFFTLTPSFNYTERWYFERFDYVDDGQTKVKSDTSSGFYRVYDYSTNASMTTRLYGTLLFKKGYLRAIRHTLIPTVSVSYRPDFGKQKFGYYEQYDDANGNLKYANRFESAIYGVPGTGRNGSIGFSLGNNLEAKVLDKSDSLQKTKKVTLLNNLSVSSGYNFLAERYRLSNISISTATSLFGGKLNASINGSIDPYVYREDDAGNQVKLDEYTWEHGKGIGQLSSLTIGLSSSLNPATFSTKEKIEKSKAGDAEKEFMLNNPNLYVDFDLPWNLSANYSLTRSKIGLADPNITQSLSFNGDLRITQNTMITFTSGYDFESKEFTQTQFSLTRNLHCWEMLFTWTPFGRFESYDFTIRVKSSMLQDLKINRRRSFFDR